MPDLDSARSQVEQRMQQFRAHYPMGGIVTNVSAIRGENYVVQAVLSVGGIALTSGLAEASTLDGAEAIAQLIALDRFNPSPGSITGSMTGATSGPATGATVHSTAANPSPSAVVNPSPEVLPPKDPPQAPPKEPPQPPEAKLNGKAKPKKKTQSSKSKRSSSKAEKPVPKSSSVPETPEAPESPVPESPVPESSVLESPVPETPASETSVPELPEGSEPEQAPAPEISASQPPASEEEVPEPQDSAPQFVADWSDDLAQIEVELKRLGWDAKQEADYLQRTYGKPSRDYITDYGELTDFLSYLRSLPSHFVPEPYSETYAEPEAEIHIPADYDDGPAQSNSEAPPVKQDFGGLSRNDMMQQTAAECKRLKWTNRQGSNFLKSRYDKPTRKDLSDAELWDFLQYLSSIAPVETSVTEQLPF